MGKLSLDEYVAQEIENIHKFREQWIEKGEDFPEHYPEFLNICEWDEQYRTYNF